MWGCTPLLHEPSSPLPQRGVPGLSSLQQAEELPVALVAFPFRHHAVQLVDQLGLHLEGSRGVVTRRTLRQVRAFVPDKSQGGRLSSQPRETSCLRARRAPSSGVKSWNLQFPGTVLFPSPGAKGEDSLERNVFWIQNLCQRFFFLKKMFIENNLYV